MVLYANDEREWVKKTCCPYVAAWIIIAWVETKKEWASKFYALYQLPCLRMPLSGLKDTVLGVRGAVLMGLWRWDPPRAWSSWGALLEELLGTVSAPGIHYDFHFSFITFKCAHVPSHFICVCLILCNPMECSPPGSTVHGILRARILEWVAMPSSRGSSQPRGRTCVSYVLTQFLVFLQMTEKVTSLN